MIRGWEQMACWREVGRRLPASGEGHRVGELGTVVSCGGSGEKGWRAELELGGRKSLDDHHGPATFGTEPKRSGFLGWGCFSRRSRIGMPPRRLAECVS